MIYCIYYTDIRNNECCTLGINYTEMCDPANFGYKWYDKLPCELNSKYANLCNKREFQSIIYCMCGWKGQLVDEYYCINGYRFVCPKCGNKIHESAVLWRHDMLLSPRNLQYVKEIDEVAKQIKKVNQYKSKSIKGQIGCPVCNGIIKYIWNYTNDHTIGICQTEGCISWRE